MPMDPEEAQRFGLAHDAVMADAFTQDPSRIAYLLPPAAQRLSPNLWVVTYRGEIDLNFAFLERFGNDAVQTWVTVLMSGWGILEDLKECRHTYWGDEGYIHYPNAAHIRACLAWLEQAGFTL